MGKPRFNSKLVTWHQHSRNSKFGLSFHQSSLQCSIYDPDTLELRRLGWNLRLLGSASFFCEYFCFRCFLGLSFLNSLSGILFWRFLICFLNYSWQSLVGNYPLSNYWTHECVRSRLLLLILNRLKDLYLQHKL